MIKAIRDHIGVKLLFSYLIVLLVGVAIILISIPFTAPEAYNRHIMMMDGSLTPAGIPGMMGQGPQAGRGLGLLQGQRPGFADFSAGIFEALTYAIIAAVLVAIIVSVIFSRSIVAPVRAMMSVSQRIAAGHYDERVAVKGSDEIAELGERFNLMAERLEQTETMRRQLLGDVSHELRTPLTAIGGYMEGLQDGILPATPETFEQVRSEALRLNRLVDDLQELSRVEAGAYQLDIHPVALAALFETALKRLSIEYQEKQIQLVRDLPVDLPMVLADEDRIIQVLTNLLGNARAYTMPGGQVTVAGRSIGAVVEVSVNDNGIGIPAGNLEHVFDRFYRVDKSRSRAEGGGSGIGLTIAKALVEAHGGHIRVESAGPGQGSTFSFTLPAAATRP